MAAIFNSKSSLALRLNVFSSMCCFYLMMLPQILLASDRPCQVCSIAGPTSVAVATTQTYNLNITACGGAATSWTTSCGTIQSSNQGSATIFFGSSSCGPATVTAYRNGSPIATLSVSITAPLSAGSVSPASQNINSGMTASTLSLTGVSGGNGSYTYLWYSSPTSTGTYTLVTGATGATYSPGAITSTKYYKVSVTSGSSNSFSAVGQVNVYPALDPGAAFPSQQTITYNTAPHTISAPSVTGGSSSYTYQWQSCPTSNGTYVSISGATAASYTPPALTSDMYYRCLVTSTGQTLPTSSAWVQVAAPLTAGTLATPTAAATYGAPYKVLNGQSPTGGAGTRYFKWRTSADGVNYQDIPNSNTLEWTVPNMQQPAWFIRQVSTIDETATSNAVHILVNPQIFPGTITPSSLTIASGSNPGALVVSKSSGGACSGNFSYQWQFSTTPTVWTDILNANNLSYSPGTLTVTTSYRVKVTCGTDVVYTGTANIIIGSVQTDLSYIRERDIQKPGVVDSTVAAGLASAAEFKQSTQYFDGLGRVAEKVDRQASPFLHDVVSSHVYDSYGKESTIYLPYTSPASDGNYKIGWRSEQNSFMSSIFSDEQFFYSGVSFEPSPLNRTLAKFPAGSSWIGERNGNTSQYLINTAGDSVRVWTIGAAQGSIPATSSMFLAGQLFKNITTDEQGRQLVEYRDKDNRVVLKKAQLWSTPALGHSGWLCTYYIYDDFNNLRFVIQPRAVDWLMTNNWIFNGTFGPLANNELCFRYEYDTRKRVIVKKMPGSGEVLMVYDARDRVVMTQDGNLRNQNPVKWMVTEYDSLSRPCRTGLLTDSHDQVYHQNLAGGSVTYPNTSTGYEVLTQTFYDDYSWVAGSGSGLGSSIATNRISDANLFYTSSATAWPYPSVISMYPIANGLSTGSMGKVLGSSPAQYLYTVSFYDDHGRVIQAQNTNFKNGIDTLTTQYDFSGKALRTFLGHKKAGTSIQNHYVLTKMTYDAGSRLKSIVKNIDGTGDQLIDSVQYDELQQVKRKFLGSQVDDLNYDYNVRGWLTGINKSYLTSTAMYPSNYFGMEIGYDKAKDVTGNAYANRALNGNVSGTLWKGRGDGALRKYDFSYDNVNRLTGADFNQYNGSLFDKSANVDYSVSGLTYDANGNILSMKQKGLAVTSSVTIDSLTYTYNYSGISNRLLGVVDGRNDQGSLLGDFHYPTNGKGGIDYTYDANGNQKTDFNKSIDTIIYNHLNLPERVHMKNKGYILYTYDAVGNKLAKTTMDSISRHATTSVYMAGGFVYQHGDTIITPNAGIDTLQFATHEEGRARWAFHRYLNGTRGYKWEYDFFEKDHMGNTRTVLTQQKDTAQYIATMEAAYRNTENALFYNIPQSNVYSYYVNAASGPNPFGTAITNPNDSVCRLNGNTPHEGPAIILKVMAGDMYRVVAPSFWKAGQTSTGTVNAIADILGSLANGIISVAGGSKGNYSSLSNTSTSPLLGGVNAFRNDNNPTPPSNPKAYLNFIALDDQFNYDPSSSGARPVGPAEILKVLDSDTIRIKKNGYLYIYLLNETKDVSVFFDNLSVTHYSGPLLEETHYYPSGLTMAGISDKALKYQYAENKFRYNGKEFQTKEFADGSGLEQYDFSNRSYDPQLSRWSTIDPKADQMRRFSPYSYAYDNPMRFTDPDGMAPEDWVKFKTSDGVTRVKWDANVTTDKEAEAAYGEGAKTLGQENTWYSNSNGLKKWKLHDGGKFEEDPLIDLDALGKSASGLGTGAGLFEQGALNGFRLVGSALNESVEHADDFNRLKNAALGLVDASEKAGKASRVLGIAGLLLTTADGFTNKNGWQNHHTADLVIGTITTFALGSGPIGWGVGLAFFAADLITTSVTGKSITQNLFDKDTK